MGFKPFKYFSSIRQAWLAVLTLLALVMLIVIQVSWIVKAARLEERIFNHRVGMAMTEVRDKLSKKATDNKHMKDYLCGHDCPMRIREAKIHEVDSIIRKSLDNYNITLEYSFFISNTPGDSSLTNQKKPCYLQSLNGFIEKDGIRLGMQFPERNQFLMAQMKGWFVISLLFIVFIATSFVITLRLFLRERAQVVKTTDFINNMVHEFQTPLANMKLAANLIRKKTSPVTDPKISEYTEIILRENEKMESNVQEILKIASLEHTASPQTDVNIHHVLQMLTGRFQYRAQERGGEIELNLNAEVFGLFGQSEHFTLLFSNLIDNALKYTPDNPKIEIKTYNNGRYICIEVIDNGIGIDDADLSNIFEKYFRVSTGNLHNVKGFGLGLTYVKKIVDLYHGTIQVKSQLGKGTTFIVSLPVKQSEAK
jgi:two-component system phosphate regulon sensor histidine kinase PhoR